MPKSKSEEYRDENHKREIVRLLQRKKIDYEKNKCKYFIPNGKQEEYLNSDAFINIFSAANGVGKSAIAANILVNLVYGPQNKWFDNEFFRNFKRPCRIRIASDPTVVENKTIPELQKWIPADTYTSYKNRRPYESRFEINAGPGEGSLVDILTYNQEPKEYEAVELDAAFFDEPPPRSLLTPTVRGFRFGGVLYITMTPLKGAGFLFEQMEELEFEEKSQDLKRKRRSIIYGHVEENCKQHGTRGILEHHHIQQMISEYDEEEKKARIEGKPMYLLGSVYKMFGSAHVIPVHRVPRDITRYMAIDPADAKPHAIVWAYVNKQEEIVVYRELLSVKPVEELVKEIIELENGEIITGRYMDGYFGKKPSHSQSTRTVKDTFQDAARALGTKMFFRDGPTGAGVLEAGHQIVRNHLYYDPNKEIDGNNIPKLFFTENCRETIKSMKNYKYIEVTGKMKERNGVSGNVGEKWKDLPDALRFIIQSNPRYLERRVGGQDINDLTDPIMPTGTGY